MANSFEIIDILFSQMCELVRKIKPNTVRLCNLGIINNLRNNHGNFDYYLF